MCIAKVTILVIKYVYKTLISDGPKKNSSSNFFFVQLMHN
jgi:hypothetical protein